LYPERFDNAEDDGSRALLQVLRPGLFAAIVALVYLHRRLNKVCDVPEWDTLSKEVVLNMEVGYIVGDSLKSVGPELGVLIGGIRYIALATVLMQEREQYVRYRNIKRNKLDIFEEHRRWGCDHAQIAGFLVGALTFRRDSYDIAAALRGSKADPLRIRPELDLWRATVAWIDSMKEGGTPPKSERMVEILAPEEEEVATLKARFETLLKQGSTFSWMLKGVSKELDI
jgi:hypothetical protein